MDTVAAIDCGTNSIKLLIGRIGHSGGFEVLLRDSRVVRLGQGVDTTGELADEALQRTFTALDEFAALINEHGVGLDHIRFAATSATRDASNAALFTDGVCERLGVTPSVLSGDQEAALVYAGATGGLRVQPDGPVLVVDIGGGSTELVLGLDGVPQQAVSMDIGSVRLHERHLHDDPPTTEQIAECLGDIERHLDGCGVDIAAAQTVIGTSGTIKTIAAGLLGLAAFDRDAIDGSRLGVAEAHTFVDRLLSMSVAERRALPYMHPGRADVIGAGALIWDRILCRVTPDTFVVSEADILYGIARSITGSA